MHFSSIVQTSVYSHNDESYWAWQKVKKKKDILIVRTNYKPTQTTSQRFFLCFVGFYFGTYHKEIKKGDKVDVKKELTRQLNGCGENEQTRFVRSVDLYAYSTISSPNNGFWH